MAALPASPPGTASVYVATGCGVTRARTQSASARSVMPNNSGDGAGEVLPLEGTLRVAPHVLGH